MERLDKFLSDTYTKSRSKAKELLKQGRVLVNGLPQRSGDVKIDPQKDTVLCDGVLLTARPKRRVLLLHKPAGCVTALRDREHKTVMEYLPPEHRDLCPVGRLDKDTEGLLLFTDDGDLAHRLISPKHRVKKLYYAEHEGTCTLEDVLAFREGLTLGDGCKCLPAELEILGEGKSLVTVTEGMYHQVRRMLASRGKPVTYLKRLGEGSLHLGDLPLGMTRELTEEEIASLFPV